MNRVKLFWLVPFLCMLSLPCLAQVNDSVIYVYSLWKAKQRQAIGLHLQLKESEKTAFWSVYDSYLQEIEFLEIDYLQIAEWNKKYASRQNRNDADFIYSELLKNDYLLAKIRRQYYRKFQRVLSTTNVIEFMRLDQNMRTLFRMDRQKNTANGIVSEIALYSLNASQIK